MNCFTPQGGWHTDSFLPMLAVTWKEGLAIAVLSAAAVAIGILLILLLVRYRLTLHVGENKTVVVRYAGFSAVKVQPPAPREGYAFAGWYLDEACTRPCGEVYRMPMHGGHLYAKWVSAAEEPAAEELTAEPVAESVVEEPAAESVAEEPIEEPVEELVAEESVEEPVVEEPAAEEPVEEPVAEESVEEPVVEEPAAEEPVEEPVVEEPAAEPVSEQPSEEEPAEEEDEAEAGEGDEFDNALVTTVTGAKVFVQYRRSFTARLIQADDEIKDYYNRLRNAVLSNAGVKERVSWNYDSYNVGRRQFVKINANRKSLIVYFALPPAEVDEKYRFRDVSEKKRYANVPVRYKVTGSRSFAYALELLEQTASEFGLEVGSFEEHLDIPYEEREPLIRRRLIRVYAKRETGENITEEQLEEMIREGAKVESLSAYTVTDAVTVNEAESLITDSTAKQLVALAEVKEARLALGKRTYINLDTISANYREGETVDLASLQAKGLIDKKAVACKVLARGRLDKSLTVEAADFSLPAIKMIVLTGGKVVKVRRT